MSESLVKAAGVSKHFSVSRRGEHKLLKAVNNVSLMVERGETVGLVGESGCGKSTLGRTILNLYSATSGEVYFRGERIDQYHYKKMLPLRREMQMIYQDPFTSLNPKMRICQLIRAPLDAFKIGTKRERMDQVVRMMEEVGLGTEYLYKYPHEMSGGQRQRVVIARAMISHPSFVVCDEPVSALDVSVRSQVLNLMNDLQKETGVAYLFISHDLSVVSHICSRIIVMYLGSVVEAAACTELFENPVHPYVKALLSAIPIPDVDVKRQRIILEGDVPSPINPPSGCTFHTRCPYARPECREQTPQLRDIGGGHCVSCHFSEEMAAAGRVQTPV